MDQLVRVGLGEGGALVVGRGWPGRGAWLCQGSPACFEQAAKRRAFERALRHPVDAHGVEQLRMALRAVPTGVVPEGSEGSVL